MRCRRTEITNCKKLVDIIIRFLTVAKVNLSHFQHTISLDAPDTGL